MSGAHVHLLVNHLPIVGVGLAAMLWATAWWMGNTQMLKVLLGVCLLIAVGAMASMASGERAESVVEHLADVSKPMLEAHEEAAEFAFWITNVLGLTALAGLLKWRKGSAWPTWYSGTVMVLLLLGFGVMARVGYFGGMIRHAELRSEKVSEVEK